MGCLITMEGDLAALACVLHFGLLVDAIGSIHRHVVLVLDATGRYGWTAGWFYLHEVRLKHRHWRRDQHDWLGNDWTWERQKAVGLLIA